MAVTQNSLDPRGSKVNPRLFYNNLGLPSNITSIMPTDFAKLNFSGVYIQRSDCEFEQETVYGS
jgi:hypothetical protein